MGGHGGLNILPQKRWNVYGRENRLKVARDEAAYEEEQQAKRAKHQKAEQEHRRQQLLQRARQKYGTEESSSDVAALAAPAASKEAATEQPALLTAAASCSSSEAGRPLAATEAPAEDSAVVKAPEEGQGLLQHINFWQQDELRLEHPEVQHIDFWQLAEKRLQDKSRGKKDTQTSDARFDASFELGHCMRGKDAKPWYVSEGSTLPSEADEARLQSQDPAFNAGRLGSLRDQRHPKSRKKHHEVKHKKQKAPGKAESDAALERLRLERRQREAAEHQRQQGLLSGQQRVRAPA
eukprot:jgi/Astpho2/2108/Aster-x1039